MYHIHSLNKISPKGMELWTKDYQTVDDLEQADAVLVRSANMHEMHLPEGLLAVARAGAGVNNIPLTTCAEKGIVVFNTPGANANSVMEMTLCGMLLACRDVVGGINWVQSIKGSSDVARLVEKGKSQFAGHEIRGKSLGVIGLGAVGGPLANAARGLGMKVYGCDPFISIDAAWHLDSHIVRVNNREELYAQCDILSLHTPLLDDTRKMINAEAISKMKDGVIILNFARDLLVDDEAMAAALASGKVARYVTDFPNEKTANMPGCIAIPPPGCFHGGIRGQLRPNGGDGADGLPGKRQHQKFRELSQLRYGPVQGCQPGNPAAPEHSQLPGSVYRRHCRREHQHRRPDEQEPGRIRLHHAGSGSQPLGSGAGAAVRDGGRTAGAPGEIISEAPEPGEMPGIRGLSAAPGTKGLDGRHGK